MSYFSSGLNYNGARYIARNLINLPDEVMRMMKKTFLVICTLALSVSMAQAQDDASASTGEKIKETAHEVGEKVKETGHEVGQGVKHAAHAASRAAHMR